MFLSSSLCCSDVCNSTDLPEFEIISLLEEQLPVYRLRADTVYGYDHDDWLHTPLVAPDARLDLTTEQIEETLKYFCKSAWCTADSNDMIIYSTYFLCCWYSWWYHSKVDSKVRHDIKGECKGMTGDMLILAFLSRIKLANLNTSKLNHYSSFWSSVNRIFHGFVEPFHAKLTILNHYNLDRTITQLT